MEAYLRPFRPKFTKQNGCTHERGDGEGDGGDGGDGGGGEGRDTERLCRERRKKMQKCNTSRAADLSCGLQN